MEIIELTFSMFFVFFNNLERYKLLGQAEQEVTSN